MNLVSFFHRFLGPPPPESKPAAPVSALPIEERYWSPAIHNWLMRHRYAVDLDPPTEFTTEHVALKLIASGAHAGGAVDNQSWVWTAWITFSIGTTEAQGNNTGSERPISSAQRFLTQYHYWAPPYPGSKLAVLREQGGAELQLPALFERALPPEVAHLSQSFSSAVFDQRLAVWASLDTGGIELQGESLRSLLDIDPPEGMEAPQAWGAKWLEGRTYERWKLHGIVYGFTHHSGFVLHNGQSWLERLCRPRPTNELSGSVGAYFDLALLVFSEIALELAAHAGITGPYPREREGCSAALRFILDAFPTPVDQGRDLLRTWRHVYRRDLGLRNSARGVDAGRDPRE